MSQQAVADVVLCEQRGATCVLTLNRPEKRNALETASYLLLTRYLNEAMANPAVANIVLQGAEQFFCSGGDLLALQTRAALPAGERAEKIEDLQALVRTLRFCSKPVIAAIEGGAAGAGASLALAADLIVASHDSYISMAYVKSGLVPDGGASGFLALSLPPQLAAEIALLGERVPVARLAAAGVVNRLVEPGSALTHALALASELAQGAQLAQRSILALLDAPDREAFNSQLQREKARMAIALGDPEAAAGIAAFTGKHAPVFPQPAPLNAARSVAGADDVPQIVVQQQGAVLRLCMRSPGKKNALNQQMYRCLAEQLDQAAADDQVRVVLIEGADGVFTSGNDVNDFRPRVDGEQPASQHFLESLVRFPKPLVAKVEGLAVGVGCTMLLHCDLVFASDTARFSLPFVNLGLVPEAASSYLIPRLMGHARASELLLLGEMFPADVAKEVGLVGTLCDEVTLARRVDEALAKLAAKPPHAIQQTKALMRKTAAASVLQRVQEESVVFGACIAGPEFAEARAAFSEKRPANFSSNKE